MAEKRMLTTKVTDNDSFTELSAEAQALYFHIIMAADDDGFCGQIRPCMYKAHADRKNLKELVNARFLIEFRSGVIAVKHWFMHNSLRKDRYTPTSFSEERQTLTLKENGAYTENVVHVLENVEQATENVARRIEENRIEENRIEENNILVNDVDRQTSNGEQDDVNQTAKMPDYEAEFDGLWERYPNKKGKRDALRHYVAARKKGVSLKTVSDGLDAYLAYIRAEGTDEKYVKHGSAWFNQHAWEDDYSSPGKKSGSVLPPEKRNSKLDAFL